MSYYERNKEKILEYQRQYNRENKHKIRQYRIQYDSLHQAPKEYKPPYDKLKYQREYHRMYRAKKRKESKAEQIKDFITNYSTLVPEQNNNEKIFVGFNINKEGNFFLEW